jgi:hypothetical protein
VMYMVDGISSRYIASYGTIQASLELSRRALR